MSDKEWAERELRHFQREELMETERVKKAVEALEAAEKELALAKESLTGARGCVAEMNFQLEYFKEHGRLP
jgi:hypothetical protein